MQIGMERPQNVKVVLEKNNVMEQTLDASVFNKMHVNESFCKIGSELVSFIPMTE